MIAVNHQRRERDIMVTECYSLNNGTIHIESLTFHELSLSQWPFVAAWRRPCLLA